MKTKPTKFYLRVHPRKESPRTPTCFAMAWGARLTFDSRHAAEVGAVEWLRDHPDYAYARVVWEDMTNYTTAAIPSPPQDR